MKPAKFDYFAPATLVEALGMLEKYGEDAKILAGGQSLVPLMNMRLAQPKVLIDINGIPGLDYVREQDGNVAIGSLTRHRTIKSSPVLSSLCPLLPAVAENVADAQVRNRGTFAGSICHADPAAEFPAATYTLGATVICTSSSGQREVPIDEFIVGPLTAAVEPNEIVTEVRVPSLVGRGWGYQCTVRRHGDFAVAGVMTVLSVDGEGLCRDVHIGLYSVAPTPMRANQAEAILEGQRVNDALLQEAANAAAEESDPETDLRGTAEYRRKLLRLLVPQALRDALGSKN